MAKNLPKRLKEAPRVTKTVEKPRTKKREFSTTFQRVLELVSGSWRPSKDMPVMKERYEGNNGKTQGERKEKRPAPKATRMEMFSPNFMPSH
jgi:hypothetical protein